MNLGLRLFVLVMLFVGCEAGSEGETPAVGTGEDEASSEDSTGDGEGDCIDGEMAASQSLEKCNAATTEAQCMEASSNLPCANDCDDCGGSCAWGEYYSVEAGNTACEVGEVVFRCGYVRFGEGGAEDCTSAPPCTPHALWRSFEQEDGSSMFSSNNCAAAFGSDGLCRWSSIGELMYLENDDVEVPVDHCNCLCESLGED